RSSLNDVITNEINRILSGFQGEPNGENTWTSVKNEISSYLQSIWYEGKLFGASTADAFYIKADHTTMTQTDIMNGKLIVEVGLAFNRPAEFDIMRFEQKL